MAAVDRLITERMLGKLARWLRLMGFDAPMVPEPPLRLQPGEILLTRRRSLVGKPGVIYVVSDSWLEQLKQVMKEAGLELDEARCFTRCLDCNLPVEPLSRKQARSLVPEFVWSTAESFSRCPACGKIFWPGSHTSRAEHTLAQLRADLTTP
ncbi:MAG: Mut7-C RNAse domain-containing protein [Deltaproteobacteria bacterium]|nr:Mut7-C RNAse domain-containing protein [Deltaproteobacteria bacterium]